MNKLSKLVLTLNAATVVRSLRHGPREAARRAFDSYDKIDPFGGRVEATPEIRRHLESIPEVGFDDLPGKADIVRLNGNHPFKDGSLPATDLMALLRLLADAKPKLILEIGTFNGATTANMALNAPQATIHTVDLPLDFNASDPAGIIPKDDFHLIAERKVGAAYRALPEITNVVQHFVDSAEWDFAPLKGATFFFIDGSHTYEYARNDTEKALAVAGPGARFLLHDCDPYHAGVLQYCAELKAQGRQVVRIRQTALAYFDT